MQSPIGWGWSTKDINRMTTVYYRFLSAELVTPTGNSNWKNQMGEPLFAWNTIQVTVDSVGATITLGGFFGLHLYAGYGRNYGIPAGLYTVKAYMWGYVEQVFERVNLGLCGSEVHISDHLYRGAKFNLTIYSKDWQHPTVDKEWSFPYYPIYVQIFKEGTFLAPGSNVQHVMPITMQGYGNTSVAMWPYMWNSHWHMIKKYNAVAQMFDNMEPTATDGTPPYFAKYGPHGIYYEDYFGPSRMHGVTYNGQSRHFRYYDGSEHYSVAYNFFSSTGGVGSCIAKYPLSFESGTYEFKGLTYGYVQKKPVTFYATKGNATSDILIKLHQGAEIQATINFTHEGIYDERPFDAQLRVRVHDDANKWVG
jgi:hypothetical protein